MKRRIIVFAAFVLLGAVVSVLVAWIGCTWTYRLDSNGLPVVSDSFVRRDGPIEPEWRWFQESLPFHRELDWRPGRASLARFYLIADSLGVSASAPLRDNRWRMVTAHRISAGWPMHCLTGASWSTQEEWFCLDCRYQADGAATTWLLHVPHRDIWIRNRRIALPETVPLLPIWPGFAVNTMFHGLAAWTIFCGPFALRRRRRRRRGSCIHCGYDLHGLSGERCPECGRDRAGRMK